jgi:hypothetical protein
MSLSIQIFKDGSKTVVLMFGEHEDTEEHLDVLKFTTRNDSILIETKEEFKTIPCHSLSNYSPISGTLVFFTTFYHQFNRISDIFYKDRSCGHYQNHLDSVWNSSFFNYPNKSLPIIIYRLLCKLYKQSNSDYNEEYIVHNMYSSNTIKSPQTTNDLIQYLMELNDVEQRLNPNTQYFSNGETKYDKEINKYYIISHIVLLTAEIAGLTYGSLYIKNNISTPWSAALLIISLLSLVSLHFVINSKMSLKVIQVENHDHIPYFAKRFLVN